MTDEIKQIVGDFEDDMIASVKCGAGELKLESHLDRAVDRLRKLKEGADSELLEAIFDAFFEMKTKLDMAMKVIAR